MIEFVVGLVIGLVVGATTMAIKHERQTLGDWREENLRKTRRDVKMEEDQ